MKNTLGNYCPEECVLKVGGFEITGLNEKDFVEVRDSQNSVSVSLQAASKDVEFLKMQNQRTVNLDLTVALKMYDWGTDSEYRSCVLDLSGTYLMTGYNYKLSTESFPVVNFLFTKQTNVN